MSFTVTYINNKLIVKRRPDFTSNVKKTTKVSTGQDRRHILHGAIQIINVLIYIFNNIIERFGEQKLTDDLDGFLERFRSQGIKFRLIKKDLITKVKKVITIAFSSVRNLVVGSAVHNQGIEQARKSICYIKKEINKYCLLELREFSEVKTKTLKIIGKIFCTKGDGQVAEYRREVLCILRDSVENTQDIATLMRVLADIEFSCTLDIIHNDTDKKDNIWGLDMANKLQQAIREQDHQSIFEILLYEL